MTTKPELIEELAAAKADAERSQKAHDLTSAKLVETELSLVASISAANAKLVERQVGAAGIHEDDVLESMAEIDRLKEERRHNHKRLLQAKQRILALETQVERLKAGGNDPEAPRSFGAIVRVLNNHHDIETRLAALRKTGQDWVQLTLPECTIQYGKNPNFASATAVYASLGRII